MFEYYARQTQRRAAKKEQEEAREATSEQELDMDLTAWTKWCKDFKVSGFKQFQRYSIRRCNRPVLGIHFAILLRILIDLRPHV